jgi:hypothetical protein
VDESVIHKKIMGHQKAIYQVPAVFAGTALFNSLFAMT